MSLENTHKYDDIIDIEYRKSDGRKHMSMTERAAQFSPFAALTGFEGMITETGDRSIYAVEHEIEHESFEEF